MNGNFSFMLLHLRTMASKALSKRASFTANQRLNGAIGVRMLVAML
jgi:hypothetical protein